MNRKIIITGTRKGIGKNLAKYYLRQGDTVFGCSRNPSSIESGKYIHYELDIADEEKVKNMFYEIRSDSKYIDILINNAGIASMNHSLLTNIKTVKNIFETNFTGTFLFCREAAKLMQKQNQGRIINFTTVAVPLHLEGEAIYASSKAAVVSLTKILAKEFANYGITVNAIGPTPIKTDLIKNVPKSKIEVLINKQSIKRYGTFKDTINVIDFFINEKSDFITGQIIYLGGL